MPQVFFLQHFATIQRISLQISAFSTKIAPPIWWFLMPMLCSGTGEWERGLSLGVLGVVFGLELVSAPVNSIIGPTPPTRLIYNNSNFGSSGYKTNELELCSSWLKYNALIHDLTRSQECPYKSIISSHGDLERVGKAFSLAPTAGRFNLSSNQNNWNCLQVD